MSYLENKKTWKVSPDASSALEIGRDWVSMNGPDPKNFLSIGSGGISLGGNVNFQSMPNQIKVGGLSSFNIWPLLMVPSTLVTPFPVLIPSLPLDTFKPLLKLSSNLSAMLV